MGGHPARLEETEGVSHANPFLIAALLGGFLWSGDAIGAPGADVCKDQWGQPSARHAWPTWRQEMDAANPNGVNVHTMDDNERVRFLSVYNDAEPVTTHNPERIEMYWTDTSPLIVAIIFVENGCVTLTSLMPRQLVESIISPNAKGHQARQPGGREA